MENRRLLTIDEQEILKQAEICARNVTGRVEIVYTGVFPESYPKQIVNDPSWGRHL
jgi:hypothetical protein